MGKSRAEIEAGKLETLELLQQYRDRPSVRLRDRIFKLNLPLVKKKANGFAQLTDEPFEDLYQVGTIGLLKAIENFELGKGNAFSSYACTAIEGEIRHYRRDKCVSGGLKVRRAWVEKGTLLQRLAQAGTPLAEISRQTDIPIDELPTAIRATSSRKVASLDAHRSSDGEEVGLEIPSWDSDSSHWCRVAEALGVKIQRRQDGLINATLICKTYNREFRIYWKRQATKKYLKNFPKRSRSGILYQISRGRSGGAWVSDQIALDLIRWCDPQVGMAIDTFTANSVIESA